MTDARKMPDAKIQKGWFLEFGLESGHCHLESFWHMESGIWHFIYHKLK